MPASETTFYNVKRLHAVFAVSSLALVAVTVWMLAIDHWREWKVYQRTFRDRVEPWLTEAEKRETETVEFEAREQQLLAAQVVQKLFLSRSALVKGEVERLGNGRCDGAAI